MVRSNVRRAATKAPLPRIVIACEGTKTEYRYFQAMRRYLGRNTGVTVVLAKPHGTDPLHVVRAALDRGDPRTDELWAVFDGDEHRLERPGNWHEALETAERRRVRLAVSNPSFELWYLLHFEDQRAELDVREAVRRVAQHLPCYDKADCFFPEPLERLTADASRRAQELAHQAERDGAGEFCNPSTSVYLLVRRLLEMKRG